MASRFEISMLMLHERSPRDLEARDQLQAALPEAEVGEPDDVGFFEVAVDRRS